MIDPAVAEAGETAGDLGTETEIEEATETELAEHTETETQPEPEAVARSEREIEQGSDKINRENERHAKRLAEIMGDDFQSLTLCPMCFPFAAGWVWRGVPTDPELVPLIDATIGREPAPQLRQNPDTEPCGKCGGWGDLLTGALAERSRIIGCPDCGGSGYKSKPPAPPAGGGYVAGAPGAPEVYVPPGAPPPPAPVYDHAAGKWIIP